jgi:hypothetical protein
MEKMAGEIHNGLQYSLSNEDPVRGSFTPGRPVRHGILPIAREE